jgi:transmembrane sensor
LTENIYDNIDVLLAKVILGEASEEEEQLARQWAALSDDNQRYFEHVRLICEKSRDLTIRSTVNEDDAWRSFQQRIAGNAAGATVARMPVPGTRQWLRVAAALIILFGGGWLYYNYSYKPSQYLSADSGGQVLTDTLPEGTVVTLNRQSSIRYRRQLAGDTRSVELEGEAFFNVAPDKDKPFVVHVNGAAIKVLGTSFNVRMSNKGVEVIVETGMVEVTHDNHTVRIQPNEKVVTGGKDGTLVKENNTDELYNYYRTNEFECNGTPLWRMVDKLNEVYQVHIVIGDSRLRNLLLTSTFHNESLDEILYIISRTLQISFDKRGKEIILK